MCTRNSPNLIVSVQTLIPYRLDVLDLYISNTDKVWIVDINKLTDQNLGLFDMEELATIGEGLTPFPPSVLTSPQSRNIE